MTNIHLTPATCFGRAPLLDAIASPEAQLTESAPAEASFDSLLSERVKLPSNCPQSDVSPAQPTEALEASTPASNEAGESPLKSTSDRLDADEPVHTAEQDEVIDEHDADEHDKSETVVVVPLVPLGELPITGDPGNEVAVTADSSREAAARPNETGGMAIDKSTTSVVATMATDGGTDARAMLAEPTQEPNLFHADPLGAMAAADLAASAEVGNEAQQQATAGRMRLTADLARDANGVEDQPREQKGEFLKEVVAAIEATAAAAPEAKVTDSPIPADAAVKSASSAASSSAATHSHSHQPNQLPPELLVSGSERVASSADAPQVDPVRLLNRVARAFVAAQDGGGEIRLRLSPPELGALRLEVKVLDGALVARVETETGAARTALIENLPALRERLAEQGVRIERFDVDLLPRHGGGEFQRPADHQPQDRPPPSQDVPRERRLPQVAEGVIARTTIASDLDQRRLNVIV